MPDKTDRGQVKFREGMVKKGGVNTQPSTPRPAEPPKGQAPNQHGKKAGRKAA